MDEKATIHDSQTHTRFLPTRTNAKRPPFGDLFTFRQIKPLRSSR